MKRRSLASGQCALVERLRRRPGCHGGLAPWEGPRQATAEPSAPLLAASLVAASAAGAPALRAVCSRVLGLCSAPPREATPRSAEPYARHSPSIREHSVSMSGCPLQGTQRPPARLRFIFGGPRSMPAFAIPWVRHVLCQRSYGAHRHGRRRTTPCRRRVHRRLVQMSRLVRTSNGVGPRAEVASPISISAGDRRPEYDVCVDLRRRSRTLRLGAKTSSPSAPVAPVLVRAFGQLCMHSLVRIGAVFPPTLSRGSPEIGALAIL